MIKLLTILYFLPLFTQNCNTNVSENIKADTLVTNNAGFAIVELFTSEGCSSCPPADKLAAEIATKAKENNENVFVLSEHVDYWNKIGWTDPFSKAFYSQRQNWYSQFFNGEGIYTPQMIINGKVAFVGSDRQAALRNIKSSLATTADSKMIIISLKDSSSKKYDYKIDKLDKNEILNFVLVEKQVTSNVLRGENRGKTLSHLNVARDWITIDKPTFEGTTQFNKSFEITTDKYSIIAFTQNKTTGVISGAGILR